MSFKVTIINNKNGDVIVNEENAAAIIGAIGTKNDVHCMGFIQDCSLLEMAGALEGAKRAEEEVAKAHPEVKLAMFLGVLREASSEDEKDEDQQE